jgi:hypothetical protein
MTNHEKLCAALRQVDPSTMTLQALVEHCEREAPGCAPREMFAALRTVAEEQLREADELERYGRCRKAGIRGVIDGGSDAA